MLHFSSNSRETRTLRSVTQRRLQGLFHHGYLDRIQRPVVLGEGRNAFAYALDRRGADLIASMQDVDRATVGWRPKDNRFGPTFLDHLININSVRVVTQLLRCSDAFSRVEWIDELVLKSGAYQDKMPTYRRSGTPTRIFPDGFCAIWTLERQQPASFFLEVDQGTMQNALWANKIEAYRTFRDSGLSYRHFATKHFRVLAVVNSERRLQNLKRTTEKAGGIPFVWFTTIDQIDIWKPDNFLAEIWHVAGHEDAQALF